MSRRGVPKASPRKCQKSLIWGVCWYPLLATVVALYNSAGLMSPALYRREWRRKKRILVLLAMMALMVALTVMAASTAFAVSSTGGGECCGGCNP